MRHLIWFLFALSLAACDAPETSTTIDPETLATETRSGHAELGKPIYESRCASCHDEGISGAPTIGDADTWSGRSPLWMAVLAEHAKKGYLKMPAQMGDDNVAHADIEAATEYMLSRTYPDLPVD